MRRREDGPASHWGRTVVLERSIRAFQPTENRLIKMEKELAVFFP